MSPSLWDLLFVDSDLRRGQRAAIHAVASHFDGPSQEQPALFSLPTGYGKTTVLVALRNLLSTGRTLVLCPNSTLRTQLATAFRANILPGGVQLPSSSVVKMVEGECGAREDWEDVAEDADVVVALPQHSRLAEVKGNLGDLFDLVLVDEAHHVPAQTWNDAVRGPLGEIRSVLATATPFRRDEKGMLGHLVYRHPVRMAQEEGVFAELKYVAPDVDAGGDVDVELARTAQRVLEKDWDEGYSHVALIRAGSIDMASRLVGLYTEHTSLSVAALHSRMDADERETLLEEFGSDDSDLDGLIVVNMGSEGYDNPRLKVAVLHRAHRALPTTIQFLGRLARTGTGELGPGTIIAKRSEIHSELRKRGAADSEWGGIIADLSEGLTDASRAGLRPLGHQHPGRETGDAMRALEVKVRFHARVFQLDYAPPEAPSFQDLASRTSLLLRSKWDDETWIIVTEKNSRPSWCTSDRFDVVRADVHIIHHNRGANLLFVHTSDRRASVYDDLLAGVGNADATTVPLNTMNRARWLLNDPAYFNLGLRNRAVGNRAEAYRMLTGPGADKALTATSQVSHLQGHWYGGDRAPESTATVGVSSNGKIWSASSGSIEDLVCWFKEISRVLNNPAPRNFHFSKFFQIPAPRITRTIKSKPVATGWPETVFLNHKSQYRVQDSTGAITASGRLDELGLSAKRKGKSLLCFKVSPHDGPSSAYDYDLKTNRASLRGGRPCEYRLDPGANSDWTPLEKLLVHEPPTTLLGDGSILVGNSMYPPGQNIPRDALRVTEDEWPGVDIQVEVGHEKSAVQGYVASQLTAPVIIDDHGPHEIADIVALELHEGECLIRLIHCKASSGPKAGYRLPDIYEVAGQAIRSRRYVHDAATVLKHLRRRTNEKPERFMTADGETELAGFSREVDRRNVRFHVELAQPGISWRKLKTRHVEILAGVDQFLRSCGAEVGFRVSA